MPSHKEEDLPHYVAEDYLLWEGQWELIAGIPYSMAPLPTWYHQELNLNIASDLKAALKNCGSCKVNIPVNLKIAEDTILQPDIVVVCKPFAEGLFLETMPEIVFEILSPATSKKDRTLKFEIYQNAGILYYCIVHPLEKTVEIFRLDADKQYQSEGKFTLETYTFTTSGCTFDFEIKGIW
jgi:Uma2 family endonuclease